MCLDWDQEIIVKPGYQEYFMISLLHCDDSSDYSVFYDLGVDDECISDTD